MNTSKFPWKEDWYPIIEDIHGMPDLVSFEDEHDTLNPRVFATFKNGYSISVIRNEMSYGYPMLFECAVKHPDQLCYSTPITSDVRGWMLPDGCVQMAKDIAALPVNNNCTHESYENLDDDDPEYGREAGIDDLFGSIFRMGDRS